MDSTHLTRDQIHAIQGKLGPFAKYVKALLARMLATGWPNTDRVRADFARIDNIIDRLWMTLHYLTCKDQTAGSFKEQEPGMTTEQMIRAILERAIEDGLVQSDRDPQEMTDEELKSLVVIVTRWLKPI